MPMSTDISLPKEQEPVFPPLCCRCLASDPEHKVRVSASRFSWAQLFFVWIWLFRKSVKHEVPLCDACRGPVRWRKSLEILVLVAVAVLALTFVVPWIKSMGLSRQWQKIATYGGAFVFAIPYILWCVFRPPAFHMTVGDEHVEYEFADEDYAMQFAACNPGAASDDIYIDGDDDDEFDDNVDDEIDKDEDDEELNGNDVDDGRRR
ncbi:MAG: hypothetical protein ACI91B_003237 [Planctomycetota bacterium]|jgi:hypothetical protein